MDDLPKIVAELRCEADAHPLDCTQLPYVGPDRLREAAQAAPHRFIEIRGVSVRISLTRDCLVAQSFYHLSVCRASPTVPDRAELAALAAAFFPDHNALPLPSPLGSSYQFLGPPIPNREEP
jgi:hypothetical protein